MRPTRGFIVEKLQENGTWKMVGLVDRGEVTENLCYYRDKFGDRRTGNYGPEGDCIISPPLVSNYIVASLLEAKYWCPKCGSPTFGNAAAVWCSNGLPENGPCVYQLMSG